DGPVQDRSATALQPCRAPLHSAHTRSGMNRSPRHGPLARVPAMTPPPVALRLLICPVWGDHFVASKIAVGQCPPVFFTGMRFLGLGLLMVPWLKWQKGQMHLVLPAALLMGTLHFALMFNGIALADDVSVVAVVVQLGVPISTLLAWVLLGEKVRWYRGLDLVWAFVGTMVISFDPKVFGYMGATL